MCMVGVTLMISLVEYQFNKVNRRELNGRSDSVVIFESAGYMDRPNFVSANLLFMNF